jgi:hypothetical protein
MSVLDDLAAALDPPTIVGSVPGSGYTPGGECKILEQSSPRPPDGRFLLILRKTLSSKMQWDI